MDNCVATFEAAFSTFQEDRKKRGLDPVTSSVKSETNQGTLFTFYKGTVLFRKVDQKVSISSPIFSALMPFQGFVKEEALLVINCVT